MPIPSLSPHARFGIIRANGLAFAYLDYGDSDKPPAILLHAGGLHRNSGTQSPVTCVSIIEYW